MAAKLVKEVNKSSTLWSVYSVGTPDPVQYGHTPRGDTGPVNETTCGQRSAAKNLKDTVGGSQYQLAKNLVLVIIIN